MEKRKIKNVRFVYLPGIIILFCLLFSACEKDRPESEPPSDVKTDLTVDYTKADISPAKSCEEIGMYKADDVVSISAEKIAANGNTPGFCRVKGMIDPEIAFEINLPDKWNGRFYMIGNGGHAGEAMDSPMRVPQINQALENGFAAAQTNTGHDTQKEPGASFVMSNPQKAIDYAYRAVHLTAVTGKAITKEYYATPVKYSYWNSCSNGGRQGLIEAQRFPEDFDGIVANAPWVDQTGFTIGAMWNEKALSGVNLTAEKMALVADKVMAKCDEIDGLKDSLIDDPRKCDFNPVTDVPACTEGTDSADCLTLAQAEAIAKVYQGPVSNGENIFPGFMHGSEAVMPGMFGGPSQSGWMGLIISTQPGMPSADFGLAQDTMRYLVHNPPKPDYDCMTFDFDKDIPMLDAWSKIADAKNPDLSNYKNHGGKLLMTYGWADPVLQPLMGVNYYEEALKVNGPDTKDFFRLFMIPGMSHCSGGVCPDQHDPISAIINWREKGVAPEMMIASQIKDNKVVRTRPLCPYPEVAKYKGKGSIDDAANFECKTPSDSCESLINLKIKDGKIDTASIIGAGQFKPPAGGFMMGGPGGMNPFQNTPAFCRVTATLTPTADSDIKAEVWMPVEKWNGKLVGIGNGVWAGTISHSAMAEPIAKGYATVATDTGHVGMGMDAKWAIGHKEKLVDFGHRAVHEMTVKAKEILAAYYGKKEDKAFWVSCSTGGRQGLMAAYRYPDDFDGISSMAPANPMVGLMISSLWSGYVSLRDDAHKLTPAQLMMSNKAYTDKCDAVDGVKDGLVSWPEMCSYDPGVIQCNDGDQGSCLTAPQLEALRDIYGGVKNPRTGELVFSGFTPGSEQMLAMLAGGPEPFAGAVSYFRDIVFEDPAWDFKSFDYDKDLAASYKAASDILDVPPDGLSKFFNGGRKLLLSHGWADGLIPAANTVAFYKTMTEKLDKDKVADSARLFMIPGMGHCAGGTGPSVVDMLSVIDTWVESGKAPETIIATTAPAPGQKQMTRPLCPYPKVAVYKGSGSTDDAANFECKMKN